MAAAAALVLAAGCGGTRQDATEPTGSYPVSVHASFPAHQRLAQPTRLVVRVRNAGSKTMPDTVVTITNPRYGTAAPAFGFRDAQSNLEDHGRPLWIIDAGPTGGETASTDTWALGPLRPGRSKRFVWKVTPVVPGAHTVAYRVQAGLHGKATARLRGGGPAAGGIRVTVPSKAQATRIDNRGKVVPAGP
jgi:hypothetical protein